MRRRNPCFVATQDELIASGLQPDRHGLKRGLWETAVNVYFAAGKVRRRKREAAAFTIPLGNPIRGIGQQRRSDGQRWLWAAAGGYVFRWEFGAPENMLDLEPNYVANQTVTTRPSIYDFTPYGDWMIVNDGVTPYIHKPEVPSFGVWGGEVPQGAILYMKVMNFILAFGYDTRKTRVGWSDADNIDTWTAAADNLAGSLTIDEFDTPIVTAARLGDAVAVYCDDQMSFIRYIGGDNVFGFRPGLDGIGAVGKASVATDTRVNVGMSRDGAWWTDGNTFRFIDEGIIKDYFQDNINWDQSAKITVSRNDVTGCFEFRYPKDVSTEINEGFCWDPNDGGWSPLAAPGSFAAERRIFGYPIKGSVDGIVNLDDFDYSVSQPLSLITKPLMLTQEDGTNRGTHQVSHVDELELWLKDALHIEVRVGCSDDPEGDWEWDEWKAAEKGSRIVELGPLPENPLWKIEFRSAPGHAADWQLNLQGLLLYGPMTGTKVER